MARGDNMKAKVKSAALIPILSVNFIGTLGFGIVLPFLIFLVTRFGGNAVIYGLLGATYSVFQLIGAPILGRLSDNHGRKKILIVSQFGTLVSWLIFFWAMFLPQVTLFNINSALLGSFTLTIPLFILFFSRALDGITGGNVSVANAYMADITEESERSKNYGKLAISSNLGFVIGPALAGLLGITAWGEKVPVLAAILISLIALLLIIFLLPDYKPKKIEKDHESANVRKVLGQEQKECFKLECKEKISVRDVWQIKDISYLLALYFLVFLGFNFFYIAFPVHAVQALNWDLTATGVFFSFLSIVMVLVQGPVLSYASKKWDDHSLVFSGSLILAISFLCFVSSSTFIIYLGAALLAIGNGLMWPSLLSLISKSSGEKFQGTIQGYASSLGSMASIIGLLAGGVLYNQMQANIFILSAAIIFSIFIMCFNLKKVLQTSSVPG
jgi:MFS family permease